MVYKFLCVIFVYQKKVIMAKKLNSVRVVFRDAKYDYTTNVSADATKKSCEDYFIDNYFDRGTHPRENMQKCVGIVFTDNNIENV